MESLMDKPERVCAVIVTYHPQSSVVDNARLLRPQVAEIVVVDNGSDAKSAALLSELEQISGVRVLRNPQNLGIAAALNLGIRHAANAGYHWVITFDQDSTVTPGFMESMQAAYESCPFKQKVALISPTHCVSEAAWKRKSSQRSRPIFSLIRAAMTSGSLINIHALLDAGLYDEKMFIDYVDFDACLRLWQRGYQLIWSRRSFLLHHLGSPEGHFLFGIPFTLVAHNPTRRYYIMRNRVIVYRRYAGAFPRWVMKDMAWMMLEFAKMLVFERDRAAKLSRAFKGIRDGLAGVSGPLAL
jgi:rhamnosyltransferase